MSVGAGSLVGVIGSGGGAGASCLAAAMAYASLQVGGFTALVDLDSYGPGLDVCLGIEREPGARWPDLAAATGEVEGSGLAAALPNWCGVSVLSMSRLSPGAPTGEVVVDVCAGLLRSGAQVIVDFPRPVGWSPATIALLADADALVVLVPLTVKGAAGAQATMGALHQFRPRTSPGTQILVVTRELNHGPMVEIDFVKLLGVEPTTTLRHDRQLTAAIDQGLGPIMSRRSKLRRAGAELVAALPVGR